MIWLIHLKVKTSAILILLVMFVNRPVISQVPVDTIQFFAEAGVLLSTGKTSPFWLFSNRSGTVPLQSPSFGMRTGFSGEAGITRNIKLSFGADINAFLAKKSRINFQQVYGNLKFGFLSLKGGIWEEIHGNQDSALSSGGLLWSGNAPPIPKIGLIVPDYTTVPFTKGFLKFRGGIYHGWLEDNDYYADAWLHHKYLYLQLGGNSTVHFEYGLHHFAQWGGVSSRFPGQKLPHDLHTFLKVLNGRGANTDAPYMEVNAVGNHLGSNNFAISYDKSPITATVYWQTIFEDESGMKFKNIRDGLWGIKLRLENKRIISGMLLEFINTTHQSGPTAELHTDSTMIVLSGNDNYFNNSLYGAGWTNGEMTIGTPLITSPVLLPEWTDLYIDNNKITALHCGIEGEIGRMGYTLLYTFSENLGTNYVPFPQSRKQHSFMLRSVFSDITPIHATVSVTLAVDMGDLFDKNMGVYISFRK
ncbi:MAG: hypothetical protein JXB00_12715, partial [Bacteroidales bacterium]|nr:hypothetical protein [Bacteroidales bacterium]